jgi:uncharacterized membrane protein
MLVLVIALGVVVLVMWRRLEEASARQSALAANQRALEQRLTALERDLHAVAQRPGATATAAPTAAADAPPPPAVPARPSAPSRPPQLPVQPEPRAPAPPPHPSIPPLFSSAQPAPTPPSSAAVSASPSRLWRSSSWLFEFFTTGNVVAKAGIVVLFFGVAFLVRYTAERGLFPIEYRLMAAAAGGVVLLVVGWRLRRSRPDYGVVLQGGAIGILYMTVFAAFRLYGLLPASITFALLLGVAFCSAVLAVAQGDMSLAVLGTSGGFLAPILASTGGGSHVALFSYYAVLNAGVLGIAWFRSWRFLNWLAFVFTFGIGAVWGWNYYQPPLLTTTEPFLVGFFLLFLAVAILFAHRQPPQLRGFIDGSLVFGTPAIAFGMQSVLVADIPFARAYSAVALSALYLGLARWLWRDAALRALAEAFVALAVVFLVLAVPFAFDGPGTAAAWALEGAALVWIGVRQQRMLARLAGTATLIAAGIAFAVMQAPGGGGALPVLNARFLSSLAIAVGGILAARLLWNRREALSDMERPLEWVLLVWGLLWWYGTLLVELERHVRASVFLSSALLGVAGSAALAARLARRWQWRAMALSTVPIGPLLWLSAIPLFVLAADDGPLVDLGWLAWPVVLAASYRLASWFEEVWPRPVVAAWHAGATWLLTFLAAWASVTAVDRLTPETTTWSWAMWCVVPAAFVLAIGRIVAAPPAGLERVRGLYAGLIPGVIVAAMLAWVVWASGHAGSPAPLPYVPLLNPIELTQAGALLVAYMWSTTLRGAELEEFANELARPVLACLAFITMNAAVGRAVHFYAGVPYDVDSLSDSGIFHTGISILWAATAGVLMTIARRWMDRPIWIVGAGLLAALILKLFVVDLRNIAGVARIVSFLATGILILVIGYFAPVPPRRERSA